MRAWSFLMVLMALLAAAALILVSCGGTAVREGDTGNGGLDQVQPADNHFSFLVCGDPNGRTDLLAEIVARMEEGEFLVIVGDLTTGGDLPGMEEMREFLDAEGIEYYVMPGDNDQPAGDVSAFQAVFGPDYYSVDIKDAHLVFLNNAVAGVGLPREELDWLRQDLEEAEGKTIVALAHVPPGAPVEMGDAADLAREDESNSEAVDLLEQAGAEVIYCGHLHVYLPYSSGPPRIVVSGGAGANLHFSEEAGGYHHFLRVTVEGDQVSEEVIRL
ncbi:MAG: metallophosphoesterase [Actinomycetota bacterium]|nr:metallophosphoesterase [Actinomycetota bacterium]